MGGAADRLNVAVYRQLAYSGMKKMEMKTTARSVPDGSDKYYLMMPVYTHLLKIFFKKSLL